MRRQQCGEVAAMLAKQHRCPGVIRLTQPQSTVAHRDLDTEGTESGQAIDHIIWNFPFTINGIGIDMVFEKRVELDQERIALILVLE